MSFAVNTRAKRSGSNHGLAQRGSAVDHPAVCDAFPIARTQLSPNAGNRRAAVRREADFDPKQVRARVHSRNS